MDPIFAHLFAKNVDSWSHIFEIWRVDQSAHAVQKKTFLCGETVFEANIFKSMTIKEMNEIPKYLAVK